MCLRANVSQSTLAKRCRRSGNSSAKFKMSAEKHVPHYVTAELCDAHKDSVAVCRSALVSFGSRLLFSGPIRTARVDGDNGLSARTSF